MKHSTHQHILQICAQLEASALPISVGLVKAKSTSTLPLPAIIKSINAYKGGERASEPAKHTLKEQRSATDISTVPTDLDSLVKMVLQQQENITELQEQVIQLQKALQNASKTN
jgi:hypothetical protein